MQMPNHSLHSLIKLIPTNGTYCIHEQCGIFSSEIVANEVARKLQRKRSKEEIKRGDNYKVEQIIIYTSVRSFEASQGMIGQTRNNSRR